MQKQPTLTDMVRQFRHTMSEQQDIVDQVRSLADDVMEGHLDQSEPSPIIVEIDYLEVLKKRPDDPRWHVYTGSSGAKTLLQFTINNDQGLIEFLQWIRNNTDSKITVWTK